MLHTDTVSMVTQTDIHSIFNYLPLIIKYIYMILLYLDPIIDHWMFQDYLIQDTTYKSISFKYHNHERSVFVNLNYERSGLVFLQLKRRPRYLYENSARNNILLFFYFLY